MVGQFAWPWYEEACAKALESLGCSVERFGWLDRFKKWTPGKTEPVYRSFVHRVQFRFIWGPIVNRINQELVSAFRRIRPDAAFFYNVHFIRPETIAQIKQEFRDCVLCQYANDNPFSPAARKSMWRYFLRSIPLFNLHYAYRESNVSDFKVNGARKVGVLKPYFIPDVDFPIDQAEIDEKYRCDVVFAGHYEDDGRVESLEAVCRAGYKLNLFGGGWAAALKKLSPDSPLRKLYPIQPATGRDYNRAICGAKVALSFLSTLNRDAYTRRSFQIPAMKVPMLSQRTKELERMFIEGKEAVYFSNTDELIGKLRELLQSNELRDRLAACGYSKVYRNGDDVVSRMKDWLKEISEYREGIQN